MNHARAVEQLDQLRRERHALEASYAELMTEFQNPSPADDPRERVTQLVGLLGRMANYVQMERDQNAMLFELLGDAYARLVQAYDE